MAKLGAGRIRPLGYGATVAFDGRIPLRLEIDGAPTASETVYAQAGAYTLTIVTTVGRPELPVELHSTYVGHPGVATRAIHLRLGPRSAEREVHVGSHEEDDVCVVFTPRNAVYDHAHELVALLAELGHHAGVDVPDDAFRELEAIRG